MRLKEHQLASYFSYSNGRLHWSGGFNKGKEAGSHRPDGYRIVNKFKVQYYVHRVIWCIHHGEIPEGKNVDHISGNRADNRIENLRIVSVTENNRNAKLQHLNRSGLHGVYFLKESSTFRATIGVDGKNLILGQFKTFLEAAAIRKSAELRHGFHPNHGRPA
jgi:hypothetical protein